jgi:hypothetical protein
MVHDHFLAAGEIWRAYFAGKISSAARENALRPLRAALAAYGAK